MSRGGNDNSFIKRAYDKLKSKCQSNNFIKAADFEPPEAPRNQKNTRYCSECLDTEELANKLLDCDLDDLSIPTFFKLFGKCMDQYHEIEKLCDSMMERS